ncbi:MAG: D-alanine--D-alanine ligase [Gammaproteobacteria bacterium]|nr:MAG: D-alanine--D-alanine ligase [Gammaproteobacteria bacterium]
MKRDAKEYGRTAVLLGGNAAERDVSLSSGRAVLEALRANGVDAEAVDPKTDSLSVLNQFDRAFIVLHGRGGEDGTMQGYLETMGIAYTGSRVLGSAVAMDKIRSKQLWQAQGIATPRFMIADANTDVDECSLSFPMVVKPANEGSSLGMSKVEHADALASAIDVAAGFDREILIEEWVQGAEYTIGILANKALPVIRIETTNQFYDYDAKYHRNDTRYRCPCGLGPEQEEALKKLALQAYSAVSASGWGRVDIMCDQSGKAYVIEVNTVPGMTDHSLLPKAAAAAGLSFSELVMQILDTSLADGYADTSVGAMFVGSGALNGY